MVKKWFCWIVFGMACISGAQAQSWQDILGNAGVKDALNALTDGKLSSTDIAGEWTYAAPAVEFASYDLLARAGGVLAAGKVEEKLAPLYARIGIREGAFSYTFREDGTFVGTLGKRNFEGTYAYDPEAKALRLEYKGLAALKKEPFEVKASLSGGNLQLLFKADRILALIRALSSLSSDGTLSALRTVAGQYDGMMLGFELMPAAGK